MRIIKSQRGAVPALEVALLAVVIFVFGYVALAALKSRSINSNQAPTTVPKTNSASSTQVDQTVQALTADVAADSAASRAQENDAKLSTAVSDAANNVGGSVDGSL